MGTTTTSPPTPTEVDFAFDVETIAAMIAQLSNHDRAKLHKLIGVRRVPAAKAAKPATEPYEPNTGDPRLDAFMAARHDPSWKPRKVKKPSKATVTGARNMISSERFEAEAARLWRKRGYTVEQRGDGWAVLGDGDGSYQRQMSAAYVQTRGGWKHPDDVAAADR